MRPAALLAVAVCALTWPRGAVAWNDVGYRIIVDKAVDALPKPIKEFYKGRKASLVEQAIDPSRSERHLLFEADRLEPFPFLGLPEKREAAVARFGEEKVNEVGDLPWRVVDEYAKLVEAFRALDKDAIVDHSARLAVYVGELHNPLNVSLHGDGDLYDQQGLRERFNSRFLEVYGDKLKVSASTAIFLDRPSEYVFSIVRDSYVWADNLVLIDSLARVGVSSYDRFYYEGLLLRASGVASERLSRAAENAASYWYTAWTAAGKPDLPKEVPVKSGEKF